MTDQEEIDRLIARFFAAFDNRAGRVPSDAELTALFAPQAVVASRAPQRIVVGNPQAFAAPRIELLRSAVLVDSHEWEVESRTEILGSLATRRSRYAKSGTLHGAPYGGRGTKFFQLVRLESGWRILALSWIDDVAADSPDADRT
jgi:hypothetical protein